MISVIILSVCFFIYYLVFSGVTIYFDRKYQKRINKRVEESEEQISQIRSDANAKIKDFDWLNNKVKNLNNNVGDLSGELSGLEIKVEKHIYEEDNKKNADKIKAEVENLIATGQPVSYELLQSYNFVVGNQESEENQ